MHDITHGHTEMRIRGVDSHPLQKMHSVSKSLKAREKVSFRILLILKIE